MGYLSRFADVMSANIDTFLSGLEDKNAAKLIDQELRRYREKIAVVKDETATVMANETAAKRAVDECQGNIKKWADAAMNAVKAGNDDDARKCLQKKQNLEEHMVSLQATYDAAHKDAEELRAVYDKMVGDVEALEARAAAVKGKIAVADAHEHAAKVTAGLAAASSTGKFDRLEARATQRLDKAQAATKLDARASEGDDLLARYGAGGSASSSVDDELARMKAQLAGGEQ